MTLQENRATEIRPILERTLTLMQTWGLLEQADHTWRYTGAEHTLLYNTQSDRFSMVSNDGSWRLDWHEDLFITETSQPISDGQLQEFRELSDWLDTQGISQPQHQSPGAAQLFEYYASRGETAFQDSEDSSTHRYRVQIDETVYRISRDDATRTYGLQREDSVTLTTADLEIWAAVDQWLEQLPSQLTAPPEAQTQLATQVLLQAEAIFTMRYDQEAVQYDPIRQSHVTTIDSYTLGYNAIADTFWLERQGQPLLSALNHQQIEQLPDLQVQGAIAQADVQRFTEWSLWLQRSQMEQSRQAATGEFPTNKDIER